MNLNNRVGVAPAHQHTSTPAHQHTSTLARHGVISSIAAAALVACGGGGTATPTDTSAYVSGTAAYGAPLANASITVQDSTGKTVTATADSAGLYRALVTGFTSPLLVTAIGNSGDAVRTYRALMSATVAAGITGHANVTPLTDAIVAMASSDGKSPEEFADVAKLKGIDPDRLAKAVSALAAIIKDVAADLGVANFDPLTAEFKADRSSGGDKLLDTIKVSIDSSGVSLRNVAIPLDTDAAGAPAAATVVIKDVATAVAGALPKSVVTDSATLVDTWVAQVNKCLALPQASRVSTDSADMPIALLGDCANISGFANNYKRNGYTLLQYWGNQLRNVLPDGATINPPEVQGYLKNVAGEVLAIVRISYSSPKGTGSYFEVARKVGAVWSVEGNQRKYDASIGFRVFRRTDVSTNHYVPSFGPDKGKDVGNFSAYLTSFRLSFNQSGPNGADVYAIRVKGPGLPVLGLVMARSSACGTGDYMSFYSNNGVIPAAPAVNSIFPLVTTSAGNTYEIGLAPFGRDFTGSDFYNEYRGRNSDGTPSTRVGNSIAPAPVDVTTIPELAAYTFEVFKAGSTAVADTFIVRNVAKPFAVDFVAKLPWATQSDGNLKFADPTAAFTGELSSAALSWTTPVGAPWVTSAYLFGSGNDTSTTPVFRRMNMGSPVKSLGDASLTVLAAEERDGNNTPCAYAKVPPFTVTTGYREVGLRQSRLDGTSMQQSVNHQGRVAVAK